MHILIIEDDLDLGTALQQAQKQAAARLGGSVRLAPGLEGKGCAFVASIPSHAHAHQP